MEFELDPFSDGVIASDVRDTHDLIMLEAKKESARSSLWANRLENDLKRGPNFVRNEVGYEMSPEATKVYLDRKSKYADDALMQSNFGAGVEGVRQGVRSLGITAIDALGKAVGSETLTNMASMARWNDDERMEAFEDDFVKRNIASATRSISQVLGLTLGTYATGGLLGAAGAPASLANFIASSNALAVSAGFGVSTALDAYDEAKFRVPQSEAVWYGIRHGIAEGVTEAALAHYMNLGVVAMANKPFMNTALRSGVKAADDALRASGKSVAAGVKKAVLNVAAEEGQELSTMALQMANDYYSLDRDITPEQVAMTTADVLFSTLIATSGMGGYSAVRTKVAKRGSDAEGRAVRTNAAIDAAQSAFNVIYNRPTKNEKGEDVDGIQFAVDAITASANVEQELKDLKAAQQVLFQFVGQEGRNKWNTEVAPKVLGHIAQLQAIQERADQTRMKDIPATEDPKAYVTAGPVPIPENAKEIYEATSGQPILVDEQGNPVEPKPTQVAMTLDTEPARNSAAALKALEVKANELLSGAEKTVGSEETGRRKGRRTKALAKEDEKITAAEDIATANAALEALLKVDTTEEQTANNLSTAIKALEMVANSPDSTVYDIRDRKARLKDTLASAKAATAKGSNLRLQNKVDVLARFGVTPVEAEGLGPDTISKNDYVAAKAESDKMKEANAKNARSLVSDTVRQTIAAEFGDVIPSALETEQAKDVLTPTTSSSGIEGTGNVKIHLGFAEEIIDKYANEFLSQTYETFEVTTTSKNKKGQTVVEKNYLEAPTIAADLTELPYNLTLAAENATKELISKINEDMHRKARSHNGRLTIADLESNPLTAKLPKLGGEVVEKTESEAIAEASKAIDDSLDTKEASVARHQKYASKSLAGLVNARTDIEAELKKTKDTEQYKKLFRQWNSMNEALGSIVDRLPLDRENAEALKNEYLSMEPREEEQEKPKKAAKSKATEAVKEKPSQVVTRGVPSSKDKLANQMYKMVEEKIAFAQGMIRTIQDTANNKLDSMESPEGKRATETINQYTRAQIALEGLAREFRTGTMTPQKFRDAYAPVREAMGFLSQSQTALSDKFLSAYEKDYAKRTKAEQAQAQGKTPKVISTNNPMWSREAMPIYGPGNIALAAYYGENTELGKRVGPHIQVDRTMVKVVSDIHGIPEETVMAATLAHEGGHVTIETIFGNLQAQNKAMESVARDARGIAELQDVVKSMSRMYENDPRLATNRTKDSIIGEEILTKIAQDVVLRKRKLSAPEQNLWNKFKLSVRHWLLRTGYGRNLGMKWEGRDLDYFAYKLLMDKGYQRVPIFDVSNIGEGGPAAFMKLYAGTPIEFAPEPGFPKGRLNLDFVYTGEGTTNEGWGIYLASKKETGRYYQRKVQWSPGRKAKYESKAEEIAYQAFVEGSRDYGSAEKLIREGTYTRDKATIEEAIKHLDKLNVNRPLARVYEFDIPDEYLSTLAPWEKPLSAEHKEAVSRQIEQEIPGKYLGGFAPLKSTPFSELYDNVAKHFGGSYKLASEFFDRAGIHGNMYFDQLSRKVGEGTYNYVIWNQEVLNDISSTLLPDSPFEYNAIPNIGEAENDQPMFQFIGPNAELNGQIDNYLKAKQLANDFGIKEGEVLPKEQEENALKIARATGWFPGLDGKLQTWVDDSEAYLERSAFTTRKNEKVFSGKLVDVYRHPSIFKYYPELADVETNIVISNAEPGGSFSWRSNKINLHVLDSRQGREFLAHEIQHWIQKKEGFAHGTGMNTAEVIARDAVGGELTKEESRLVQIYEAKTIATNTQLYDMFSDPQSSPIQNLFSDLLRNGTDPARAKAISDAFRPSSLTKSASSRFDAYQSEIGEIQSGLSDQLSDYNNMSKLQAAHAQLIAGRRHQGRWISTMYGTSQKIVEASGVSNEVDNALVSIAQSVLALENSRKDSKKTFGDYIDALEATYGKELNWIKATDETKAAEDYLKKVWAEQRAAKKSYPQQQKEQAALKKSLAEIGKKIRLLRKELPQMDFEGAKAAIIRNSVPDGIHDIRTLVQAAFELVQERDITAKLKMLNEAAIPLNKNIARSVRAAYNENWNVSDTVVLERAKAINDMGKITEEMLKDEIDEIEKLRVEDPNNTEYRQIEKSLQDQLQRLRFGEVQTEPGSMGTMRDRGTRLWTAILKHSSIEGYLKTFKVPTSLITAIKAAGSVRPLIHDQLRKAIEPIAYAMAKDKSIHATVNQHAILYAEGHPQYIADEFSKLPEKVQEAVVRAAAPIRGLYEFGKSLSESYGLDLDFQEHKISDFEQEIAKLMKAPTKNKDRISELHNRIALLHTTHYVNIAHKFIDKRSPKTSELVGRKTLTLYGLMKEKGYGFDEISTTDILVEYMDTLGRDIAVANIAKEAKRSAFAKVVETDKDGHLPDGWVLGEPLHSSFDGYMVDANIAEVLSKSVLNKDLGSRFRSVRTLFNIMKAKEFVNPAIMNVINAFQGTMLGIMPLQGFRQAQKDVMEMTPAYVQAVKLNVFSRPNVYTGTEFLRRRLAHGNTPRQQVLSMILNREAGKQVLQGDIMGGLKTLFSENTITGLYKASSELAWLGDEILRMSAFNVLLKRGYSPEVAANHVARVYVDYADMPVPTRKYATMMFFTPVYAFETIRGMALNAIDAANSLAKISRGKATNADMLLGAKSMLAFAAGNAMITAIMMMGGFEPEDDKWWDKLTLGYKFIKPHTTKEGLQKELSVKIAGPYIVLQRELNRFMRGLDVETPLELPGSMFRSYATMQHPLFRNLASMFNMEDKFGNPMYEEHDSGASKLGKSLKVTAVDWVPMLGWALGNRGFVTDEAREAVLKDWYVLGAGAAMDLFMYPSIRDTKQKKIINEMKYHRSAYLSSVRKHYAEYKTGDAPVLKRLKENFEGKMDELTEKLNEEAQKNSR